MSKKNNNKDEKRPLVGEVAAMPVYDATQSEGSCDTGMPWKELQEIWGKASAEDKASISDDLVRYLSMACSPLLWKNRYNCAVLLWHSGIEKYQVGARKQFKFLHDLSGSRPKLKEALAEYEAVTQEKSVSSCVLL